jgi:hypothetical protein
MRATGSPTPHRRRPDRGRVRWTERWPDALAAAILLGGRPAITVTFLAFPPRITESGYMEEIGVPPAAAKAATMALWRQGTAWVFLVSSFTLCSAFLINRLQTSMQISASPLRPISYFVLTFTYFGVIAALYGARSISVRSRLLASAVRCVRLIRASCPDPVPGAAQFSYKSPIYFDLKGKHGRDRFFELLVRNPRHRQRVTAGIAWALTRDVARLTGRPAGKVITLGEVLLWFAENPADPRRRPIVAAYLSELITDVANNVAICDTDFFPAARYRIRSPRERAIRRLRSLVTGAVATGILVALASAVLRIWIK